MSAKSVSRSNTGDSNHYGYSSSSDEDDDDRINDHVEHGLSNLFNSILNPEGSAPNLEQTFHLHRSKFNAETKDGGRVFHRLVNHISDKDDIESESIDRLEPFLHFVMDTDPSIMSHVDTKNKMALHKAIQSQCWHLCRLFCRVADRSSNDRSSTLSMMKMQTNDKKTGTNLMHLAIAEEAPSWFIEYLVQQSDDESLSIQDGDGDTPLHLLVQYKFFAVDGLPETQNDLIKNIIDRFPKVLNIENKEKQTPYQLLEECRKEFDESPRRGLIEAQSAKQRELEHRERKDRRKKANKLRQDETDIPADHQEDSDRMMEDEADRQEKQKIKDEERMKAEKKREEIKKMKKKQRLEIKETNGDNDWEKEKKKPLYDKPHSINENSLTKQYPANKGAIRTQSKGPVITNSSSTLWERRKRLISDTYVHMERLMRKTILRKFSAAEAGDILSNNRTISSTKPRERGQESRGNSSKSYASTVAPYCEIFEWLNKIGKVSAVLHIIVEDDLEEPHSDNDIVKALSHIEKEEIDIWNWRKFDISSETIFLAAPNVRELHLYTTGNKAVLQGWSDENGLRKLLKLEKIVIHVEAQMKDSERYTIPTHVSENLAAFEKQLLSLLDQNSYEHKVNREDWLGLIETSSICVIDNATQKPFVKIFNRKKFLEQVAGVLQQTETKVNNRKIKIETEVFSSQRSLHNNLNISLGLKNQKKAHEWFVSSQSCVSWVQNAISKPADRIKIALIDDGIDMHHTGLRAEICMDGRSFCSDKGGYANVSSSYYSSTTGHGTLMALLIQHMCPPANIALYIAKLDDSKTKDHENFEFTPQSAVEAIEWAIDKDVDIISMSWTIEKNDDVLGPDLTNRLKTALSNAANKNILMFCAARDEGKDGKYLVTYPAAGHDKIFKIGAAQRSGIQADNVHLNHVNYLCPGVELRESVRHLKFPDMEKLDGSSPATALATGLTALFLTILSQDKRSRWSRTWSKYDKIRDILDRCAEGNNKYIQPYQVFPKMHVESQDYTKDHTQALQDMIDNKLL